MNIKELHIITESIKPRWIDLVAALFVTAGSIQQFVAKDLLQTILIWSLFLVLTFIKVFAPLRLVALTLLVTILAFWGFSKVPYLGYFPFDLYLVALVGIFALSRFKKVSFKSNWHLRFNRIEWMSLVGITGLSVSILLVYFFFHPEVAAEFPLPAMSPWLYPFVILGLAVINGLREELLYRYFYKRAFLENLLPFWAILLQALLFGFLHFQSGFPRGWLGVFLTSGFGFLVGLQYFISRNITLSWVTHSLVDAIMFTIIIFFKP